VQSLDSNSDGPSSEDRIFANSLFDSIKAQFNDELSVIEDVGIDYDDVSYGDVVSVDESEKAGDDTEMLEPGPSTPSTTPLDIRL
jgi:hypothetical protein